MPFGLKAGDVRIEAIGRSDVPLDEVEFKRRFEACGVRPKRLESQNWRALLSAGIAPRTGKAVDVDYSFEAAETQNRKPSRQVGAKNAVLRFRVRLDGPAALKIVRSANSR